MAYEVPSKEPEKIYKGLSAVWQKDLGAYPSDEYDLSYYFYNESSPATAFGISAEPSGLSHYVNVAPSGTSTYTAGNYLWVSTITETSTGNKYLVEQGHWDVMPDPSSPGTTDVRSHAKTVLDKIEAVIEGRADSDTLSYTVAGRQLQKMPIDDLLKLRTYYYNLYISEIKAEETARELPDRDTVRIRFTDPS
jgi:hypothetical protein